METIDVIEEIDGEEYSVLLICSYGADFAFFEKMFLSKLKENGCRYISAFVDNILFNNIQSNSISEIGKSYIVRPVQMKRAFHPKMYLLLGEKKAKLLLGSGNLTPGGLIRNIEFFKKISIDEKNKDNLELIINAFNFFKILNKEYPSRMMDNIFKEANSFSYLFSETDNSDILFLNNMRMSIYKQVIDEIGKDINTVDIVAPYYDNKLKVIERLQKDIQPKEINIYIQNKYSNFPINKKLLNNVLCQEITYKNNNKKRYHGKLIIFNKNKSSYVLYGSANFSEPALLKTVKNSGNIEVNLLEKVKPSYFKNKIKTIFTINDINEDFITLENEMSHQEKKDILFIEAIKEEEKFEIYIDSKKEINDVLVKEKPGIIDDKNNNLKKIIYYEDFSFNSPFFNYTVLFSDQTKVEYTGWYNNKNQLAKNQSEYDEYIYSKLDADSELIEMEDIIQIFEKLMENMVLNEDDMTEKEKETNITNRIKIKHELSGDDDNSREVSDNIEKYFAPDYKEEYNYGHIQGINVLKNMVNKLLLTFKEENKKEMKRYGKKPSHNKKRHLKYNEDHIDMLNKNIKKFIKKFNKGIKSQRYIKQISSEIFLKNAEFFFGFLWGIYEIRKIIINENEINSSKLGFINEEYIVDKFIVFVDSFCDFIERNKNNNYKFIENIDIFIADILCAIIAKNILINKSDIHPKQKRVEKRNLAKYLKSIHNNFISIREEYKKYIKNNMKEFDNLKLIKDLSNAKLIILIEDLFNFHTLNTFKEYIEEKIDFSVMINKNKPEIYFNIDKNKENIDFIILKIIKWMVSVIEWEISEEYKINKNIKNDSYKRKEEIIYNKIEKKLIIRYFYKNGNKIQKYKERITINKIFEAEEKYNTDFLNKGFKSHKIT